MEFKWKEFFHQFRYHVDNDGKPVLTAVDRQTNAAGPLFLEDWEQDAWLLVLKHHKLISQLIGD